MSGAPLVSVIIPAYNAERFVEEAVRSIMTQTYKNLEILVTDDCSTDGTYAILQKLASEDTRIRLFRNEQNLNIVRTLNNMIAAANGTYIARMDADDVSLPDRIERQVAFMEANPDVALCGTNAWHIDEKGRRIAFSCLPRTSEEIGKFKFYACPFYHPSVLLRSNIYKNYLYDENFLYAEDYELWIRLLVDYNGYNLSDRLLYYRISVNQISKSRHEVQLEKTEQIFRKYNLNEILFLGFEKSCLECTERKMVIKYAKTLFSKNSICDLVLFVKLIKIHVYILSFWSIREFLTLLKYIFKKKMLRCAKQ